MLYTENIDDVAGIIEEVLGRNCWLDRDLGWVKCPGSSGHSAKAKLNDCKVFVNFNGAPKLSCFHTSCLAAREDANRNIVKAYYDRAFPSGGGRPKLTTAQQIAKAWRETVTLKTNAAVTRIFRENSWTVQELTAASPLLFDANPAGQWRDLLSIFGKDDFIWAGDLYDSGGPQHAGHFRTKTEWLATSNVPDEYICPAVLRHGCCSRSAINVANSPYLVVESDSLDKDQTACVFRWLMKSAGLRLVAVVDTAGKSLHGWFQMPIPPLKDQLKIMLPLIGCDGAMFAATQPCRLPGAIRDGQYQKLLYLDMPGFNSPCDLGAIIPLPSIHYDGTGGKWLTSRGDGGWSSGTQADAARHLAVAGYGSDKSHIPDLTENEYALYRVQQDQFVDYVSSLAGYDRGHYQIHGKRILVTTSPSYIEPKKGDFPLIKGILENMLGDQLSYFYSWLHISLKMFRSKKWQPGQVVAFAGEKNSGKSLLRGLLTKMFGGRASFPYKYMMEKTSFNSDIFGAEHLMVEDEAESVDIRARRHAAGFIKRCAVNQSYSCERKYGDPITLTPRQRMTISLNDEPERLQVLPPLEDDIEDKLMHFKVAKCSMPMPTSTGEERKEFQNALENQLPAFVDFILGWDIPKELHESRMGVKAYHHPDLVATLKRNTPEVTLLELIDEWMFGGIKPRTSEWSGRARALRQNLTDAKNPNAKDAERLLPTANVCGRYLKRLEKQEPDRVESSMYDNYEEWVIYPPEGKSACKKKSAETLAARRNLFKNATLA